MYAKDGNNANGRILHLLSKILHTAKLPLDKKHDGSEFSVYMQDGSKLEIWYSARYGIEWTCPVKTRALFDLMSMIIAPLENVDTPLFEKRNDWARHVSKAGIAMKKAELKPRINLRGRSRSPRPSRQATDAMYLAWDEAEREHVMYTAWEQAEREHAMYAAWEEFDRMQVENTRREPEEDRRDSWDSEPEKESRTSRCPSLDVGVHAPVMTPSPAKADSSSSSSSSDDSSETTPTSMTREEWYKLMSDTAEAVDRRGAEYYEWLKENRKYTFLIPGNDNYEHFRKLLATFAG